MEAKTMRVNEGYIIKFLKLLYFRLFFVFSL
jgi:hypothetical protein